MSDILADYELWRASQPGRIGTHSDRCHMWQRHERCMIHRLAKEIARLRLTDAEREAVEWAVSAARNVEHPAEASLRGLLERME